MKTTSIKKELTKAMEKAKDTSSKFLYCILTKEEMEQEFNVLQTKPFIAWSEDYIYFSIVDIKPFRVFFVPRKPAAIVPRTFLDKD